MQADWLMPAAVDGGASALPAGVVRSAGLLLGFAVALALVVRVMWSLRRLGHSSPSPLAGGAGGGGRDEQSFRSSAGESGHAVVEFALVFPFALMLLLLVVQVALLLQANLVVNYAAFCGARCAVVWIPRPMNNLDPEGAQIAQLHGRHDGPNGISSDYVDSPKTLRIQLAVAYGCWPIAGRYSRDFASQVAALRPWAAPTVAKAIEQMRMMPGAPDVFSRYRDDDLLIKYLYSVTNTRVKTQAVVPMSAIPPERGHYGPDMMVRVDVEHDFALQIPFAGRILGFRQRNIGADNLPVPDDEYLYVTTVTADAMLSNEGRTEYPPGIIGQ